MKKKLDLVKHTELAILEELYGITLINECAQSNTPGVLFEYVLANTAERVEIGVSWNWVFSWGLGLFWDAPFTSDSL